MPGARKEDLPVMFNLLFDNTSLPVLQQVLAFSEHRQKTLQHNIANISTPGFRASDLPVDRRRRAALDGLRGRLR